MLRQLSLPVRSDRDGLAPLLRSRRGCVHLLSPGTEWCKAEWGELTVPPLGEGKGGELVTLPKCSSEMNARFGRNKTALGHVFVSIKADNPTTDLTLKQHVGTEWDECLWVCLSRGSHLSATRRSIPARQNDSFESSQFRQTTRKTV